MAMGNPWKSPYPICSMEYLYTYIWVIYGANVGKYSMEHMGIQMELKKFLSMGTSSPSGGIFQPGVMVRL